MMKRMRTGVFLSSFAMLVLVLAPGTAFAVARGGACSTYDDCDGALICAADKTCQPDPDLAPSDPSLITPTAPTTVTPTITQNPDGTYNVSNTGSAAVDNCTANGFVSLSCIPGFASATGKGGLVTFFNLLYKLSIGAAAVIAVLQITRAGIMYMGSDSFTEKKDAKHLIWVSLLGLVLVLSPALIISIINPSINTLNIDTTGLTVPNTQTQQPTTGNNGDGSATGNGTGSGGASGSAAPANVTVSQQTSTSVAISWTAPAGTAPAKYNIYDNGALVASLSGTAATISKLPVNSTHSFTVTAVDSAGKESAASGAGPVTMTEIESVTVNPGDQAADGSEGQVAYSVWAYYAHHTVNDHDAGACWSYSASSYPVPYQGLNKASVMSKCQTAIQTDPAHQATISQFSQCVFYTHGQAPSKTAQPATPAAPAC